MDWAPSLRVDAPRGGVRGLIWLTLALVAGAGVLYLTAGLPGPPPELPTWDAVARTFMGSTFPAEAVGYLLAMLAWAVWLWLVASVAVRVLVHLGEASARGSEWGRRLRSFSDRVTLPIVRRVVDAALVALVTFHVASRGAPDAVAASSPSIAVYEARPIPEGDLSHVPESLPGSRAFSYTVQQDDTLWAIAERFYGTGSEYMRLVEANFGREMADGRRFSRTGVIHPGWVLNVPDPSRAIEDVDGQLVYTVERDDTLWGIAGRLLGDEREWPGIFELNRGLARTPEGRVLADPDLIWPRLRLRLPSPSGLPDGVPAEATSIDQSQPVPEPIEHTAGDEPSQIQVPDESAPAIESYTSESPPSRRPTLVVEEPRPAAPAIPSAVVYGAAAAGTAAVGAGIYVARRKFRRSLSEPPIPQADYGPEQFGEGDAARVFAHRVHGVEVEPIGRLVQRVLDVLAAEGIENVSVPAIAQRRGRVDLTLDADPAVQDRIADLAPTLEKCLGGKCLVRQTADRDLVLELNAFRPLDLLPPPAEAALGPPVLLPIGLLGRHETLYADWFEMNHVLVAGSPGVGADAIMTSIVASLAARLAPQELELWTMCERGQLPPQILALPHQRRSCDPSESEAASNMLVTIRAELTRRKARPAGDQDDDTRQVVLLVGEVADLDMDDDGLDVIMRDGPAFGVSVLAATSRPNALAPELIAGFDTRLVLRVDDDEESIRLLGRPDAADLGADGGLLFRIGGRSPVQLRGFRIAPEHLDQLIYLMEQTYGHGRAFAETASAEREGQGDFPSGSAGVAVDQQAAVREPIPPLSSDFRPRSSAGTVATASAPSLLASWEERRTRSLVQVRCFGTLEVTSGERHLSPEREGGSRRKSWEILTFLAAHSTRGVAKDRALSALWPGLRGDRAVTRLWNNLSELRAVLADQVPGLRSDVLRAERNEGICRLDPDVFWSDVHEFLALNEGAAKLPPDERKAAYEQARALYRGDLLTDVPYKWVGAEDERGLALWERYREEYRQLTSRLAQLYAEEREPSRAVVLYRDLLRDEPTLEDVVRQLFRCYQQLGDRNSVIREERLLREALRQKYGESDEDEGAEEDLELVEPEQETLKVFGDVLAAWGDESEAAHRSFLGPRPTSHPS